MRLFRGPGVLALVAVTAGLAGCMGRTYGTGENPASAVVREMSGGLGVGLIVPRKKKEPIDYQPRAALVMPPAGEQLPAPAQVASAANPDWPVEPKRGSRISEEDARYGGLQAEYRRLKPLGALVRGNTGEGSDFTVDDRQDAAYDVVSDKKQRETFQAALDDKNGVGRTTRRYLTEPPDELRAPAPGAPQEFAEIKVKRKSWLAGLFGG